MNDEKPAFQPCSMREGESFQLFSPVRNEHTRSLIGLDDTASRRTSIAGTRGRLTCTRETIASSSRVSRRGSPGQAKYLAKISAQSGPC
jgi:hypothetical protein